LKELTELKINSSKIETYDPESEEISTAKMYIIEINEAIKGLNNIGALSLSIDDYQNFDNLLPEDINLKITSKNKNKKVKELIKINCKLLNELDSSYLKENNLRMKLKIQRKIKLYCLMIIIKKKKINN
jgi:hypothetical protein